MENIRSIDGGGTPWIYNKSMDDIIQKINENLPINKEKKDNQGEVLTPFFLIDEMLDRLPKSVWTNPELRWLEPSSGIGGFTMVIYARLMSTLPDTYHSEKVSYSTKYGKSQHVLKYMLHSVEIDRENVIISREIFGKDSNIHQSDFLTWNEGGGITFDIIVGNPPYNEGGTVKGGGILWKEFVLKSIELLETNGFLLFVHPTGWRKPVGERASTGDLWTLFRNYTLRFLKMSDIPIPNFPRVDYYVLQKKSPDNNQKTHVISIFEGNKYEGMLDLYGLDFIPHFVNPSILRILKKVFNTSGDKFNIVRDRTFEPTKSHMTAQNARSIPYTFYYEPECREYVYAYSPSKPEYVNKKKIIMTHTRGKIAGLLYPVYYSSDEVGSSSNTMYQLVEQGDRVRPMMVVLQSKLIEFLMRITQYSETPNHKNEYKILNMIAKPLKPYGKVNAVKNDRDVYNYYGINKTEIRTIEQIIGMGHSPVKSRRVHCNIRRNFTSKMGKPRFPI